MKNRNAKKVAGILFASILMLWLLTTCSGGGGGGGSSGGGGAQITDADGDGMLDSWETTYGLDPANPFDANIDNDGDSLTNLQEYQLTSQYPGIDPTNPDTDNDTITDGNEISNGTNPIKSDTDNDGVNDLLDACPTNASGTVDSDSDQVCAGACNANSLIAMDCNDSNPAVKPGISEVCSNTIDDNCNCTIDESFDSDGDTFGACADCNDTPGIGASIYPGATEVCKDNTDNNCDSSKICDCTGACDVEVDGDLDEYASIVSGGTDCNDSNANINLGKIEICQYPLPPIDENCDSSNICDCTGVCSDGEVDSDGDTYASNLTGGTDCDDTNPTIRNYFRDFDGDTYGNLTQPGCGVGYVSNSQDCNDNNNLINPSATEICDNIDNNCAGSPAIDEGCDDDGDNYCDKNMTIVGTPTTCTGTGKDCDDTNNTIYPSTLCGTCQTCDTTGSCTNQTPVDDGRCGTIDCDFLDSSTSCIDYQDITSNRCASNGVCKTGSISTCSYTNKISGASCGTCKTCDGLGTCNQTPTDDSSLGAIDCDGLDTSCRNYNDITSNRCEGFGDPKDANTSDCTSYTNSASGTDCGTCQTCDGLGSCSLTPADDTGCTVDCDGLDTSCRNYNDITSNRCLSFGNCKPSNNTTYCTSYSNNASGTSCGTCMTCNGTGACSSTPIDDSACGTIDCDGLDTTCRNYNDLTTNRCEGFGNCKDANTTDCSSYTNTSSGTVCGASCSYTSCSSYTGSVYCNRTSGTIAACNGSGACSSTTTCSDSACPGGTKCSSGTCISSSETCNQWDDDCDGSNDEGSALDSCGTGCSACFPPVPFPYDLTNLTWTLNSSGRNIYPGSDVDEYYFKMTDNADLSSNFVTVTLSSSLPATFDYDIELYRLGNSSSCSCSTTGGLCTASPNGTNFCGGSYSSGTTETITYNGDQTLSNESGCYVVVVYPPSLDYCGASGSGYTLTITGYQ